MGWLHRKPSTRASGAYPARYLERVPGLGATLVFRGNVPAAARPGAMDALAGHADSRGGGRGQAIESSQLLPVGRLRLVYGHGVEPQAIAGRKLREQR